MLVGIQVLAAIPLAVLFCAVLVAFDARQRSRWLHLVRRSRWLVAVLALTFLLSTPGEAIAPGWPGSWEGSLAALEHGLRFVVVLAALAWLLAGMPRASLIAGTHCLTAPLRALGMPTERLIVRLALVLEYVESSTPAADWRAFLEAETVPVSTPVRIEVPGFAVHDMAACALALALFVLAALG